MSFIADGLMIAGALVAALYCWVLSARLKRLRNLDDGLGAAISGLSKQVDDMRVSLAEAKKISGSSAEELKDMTARAEIAAGRLELLLASLHERDDDKVRPIRRKAAAPSRTAGKRGQSDEHAREELLDALRDMMSATR